MRFSTVFEEQRGVSPVISVILMVAITVILAAVTATFALGLGESTSSTAPQAAFTSEQKIENVTANYGRKADFHVLEITHVSGDPISGERLRVLVNGEEAWGVKNKTVCSDGNPCTAATALWNGSSDVRAGDTISVVHRGHPEVSEGTEYTIQDMNADPDGSELYASDSEYPDEDRLELRDGDVVQVVWVSQDGRDSAVLFKEKITE